MTGLNSRQKHYVLSILLKTTDSNISFTRSDYKDTFRHVDFVALESYLTILSKKGIVNMVTYAEDGHTDKIMISGIKQKRLEDELTSVMFQYRKERNRLFSAITLCFIMMLVSIMLVYSLFLSPYSSAKEFFVLLMSLMLTLIAFLMTSTIQREKANNEVNQYSEKLRRTVLTPRSMPISDQSHSGDAKEAEENDALKLMLVNMEEIKAYYTLSKAQAKDSFRLSVWMCILGFILLVAAVVLPFFTSGKYEVSIITAIGGAIVEIIAGTSLFVYKNSLTQLNHYYESLHDNERFLSTVNLVSKLSPEKQDDMYIEIIRSGIQSMTTEKTTTSK